MVRSSSSGSSARTRAYRPASTRVSLPVPAPTSSTVAPCATGTSSKSSAGQPGRPRSYSSAARWKLRACSLANARERGRALFLDHLAGDHEPLDLVRALVDLRDLRVAHHALDRVFLHVAVAAEHLHRVGGDLHRDVGAVELRHRRDLRQLGAVGALVDQPAALVEQSARGLAFRLHVGERGRDQLVLRDRLAHRLARAGVLERVIGRALREAEALRADPGPRAVENAHRDAEALALLAEQVVGRDTAVVEEDLT